MLSDWDDWITIDFASGVRKKERKRQDSERRAERRECDTYESKRYTDRWACQMYAENRRRYKWWRRIKEREPRRLAAKDWWRDGATVCHAVTQASELLEASLLTFLLPSVTMRGTGIGGHLLRLGGGFSLFHRMMIWSTRRNRLVRFGRGAAVSGVCFNPFFVSLPASSILTSRPPEGASWLAETERPMGTRRGWPPWTPDLEWPLDTSMKNITWGEQRANVTHRNSFEML